MSTSTASTTSSLMSAALSRDVLSSVIFRYLPRARLFSDILLVSHHWLAALIAMPSQHLRLDLTSPDYKDEAAQWQQQLIQSRLKNHCSALHLQIKALADETKQDQTKQTGVTTGWNTHSFGGQLCQLTHDLPQLEWLSLRCSIKLTKFTDPKLSWPKVLFPPKLRVLQLTLTDESRSDDDMFFRYLHTILSSLPSHLVVLEVTLGSERWYRETVSYPPLITDLLASFPRLRRLMLKTDSADEQVMTAEFVHTIRTSLPQLREYGGAFLDDYTLSQLTQLPHNLKLQSISAHAFDMIAATPDVSNSLGRLPTLTNLAIDLQAERNPFLLKLTSLTDLRLRVSYWLDSYLGTEGFDSIIEQLHSITCLHLTNAPCGETSMERICRGMPKLRVLHLRCLNRLHSVEFLARAPHLEELVLVAIVQTQSYLPPIPVDSFASLTNLQRLHFQPYAIPVRQGYVDEAALPKRLEYLETFREKWCVNIARNTAFFDSKQEEQESELPRGPLLPNLKQFTFEEAQLVHIAQSEGEKREWRRLEGMVKQAVVEERKER